MEKLRIVLLGKTGSGKSSFANMIFGENVFNINHTSNPGTRRCQEATRDVNGTKITLIDTPGFFDNRMSDENLRSAITECITMVSPGPHAFLIFVSVDKFIEEDKKIISKMTEYFSEEALKYAVVVFTHGDQLGEGMNINEFIDGNQNLCDLLRKCGGRCCVVDNRYWRNNPQDEYRNNQNQVGILLNIIQEMVAQNSPSFYTNEILQEVERRIQQEEGRIQEEEGRVQEEEEHPRALGDGAQENIRIQAKQNVSKFLQKALGITTGMMLGALLGVPIMIAKVMSALKKTEGRIIVQKTAAAAAVAATLSAGENMTTNVVAVAGLSAAAGALVGAHIGYVEADRADSVGEAMINTAQAVGELAVQSVREVMDNMRT